MQSKGDVKDPEPSQFNVKDHTLWDAWHKLKGTPKDVARKEFNTRAIAICERNNLDWRFPSYYTWKKKHEQCVEDKIKNAKGEEAERLKKLRA